MQNQSPPAQASDEQQSNSVEIDRIAVSASDEPMRAAKPGDTCSACAGTGCEHCCYTGIEPRKIVGYGDCRCILSKYCDGCCNPIWADQVATKGAKP